MTESGGPIRSVAAAQGVRYPTLGDQIKDRLLTRIMEGDLPPGSRIVETKVARDLGISQGPVREALRDLAQLGLIEIRPHRGASVRQPSLQEHMEAIEVRAVLEAMAGREVAGRLDEAVLTRLRQLTEEMRALAAAGEVHDHALRNTEFHATIVGESRNAALKRAWEMVQPFAQTYLTLTVEGIDVADTVDRHLPIVDALEQGDPERVAEVLLDHGRLNAEMIAAARSEADPGGVR